MGNLIEDINDETKARTQVIFVKNFGEKIEELRSLSLVDNDLDDLIEGFTFLKDSDYYAALLKAYDLKEGIYESGVTRNKFFNSPLINLAGNYLYKPSFTINLHPLKDGNLPKFWSMHQFFEYLYHINTNNPLNMEDMENIYYSDLVSRVISLLDDFNNDKVKIGPLDEFFKNLKEVKWKKESKAIYKKMRGILWITHELNNYPWTMLVGDESDFIRFLCFCSAAVDGRVFVSVEDVVRAYRTYFKLIKFDITVFKADSEIVESLKVNNRDMLAERFPKLREYLDDPVKMVNYWLKGLGIIFIVFGVLLMAFFKYPFFLIGLLIVFTGALSFLFVNRWLCVFYGFFMAGVSVFALMNGLNIQSLLSILVSLMLFNKAWKFPKNE